MGVNVNNFKETMDIELGGHTYGIKLLTVRDYINQAVENKLERSHGDEKYLASMVELLSEYSTIPKGILKALSHDQLEALLMMMLGINPAKSKQTDDNEKEVDFAHIIGIAMSTYHCGWQEVMSMPIKAFWTLLAAIPKLQSAESLRLINAVNAAVWNNEDYIKTLLAASGDSEDDYTANKVLDKPAMSMFKRSVR